MKSAKERTVEKKRLHKEMGAKRTERSRARRVKNKHRREEIHAIDPDMKVIIVNQKTFDQHGTEIEVMNDKIRAVKLDDEIIKATMDFCKESVDYDDALIEYQEVVDKEHQQDDIYRVVKEIKTKNKSALQRLTDRFKKKKFEL